MKIPKQYLPVMPYLIVENAWALQKFMKEVFGATDQYITETGDGRVQHGEMRIHDAVIMFGEAGPEWKEKTAAMFLYVDNVDAVHARAMDLEAVELEAPGKKDYGYTSSFKDPYGNMWFIAQGDQ